VSFNFRKLCEEKKVIKRSPSIALSLLAASIMLQGCQSVKKTLGIDRDPPNEYAVTPSVQPLEMPPEFSCLPIPTPGVERPQDRAARQNQKEKFLGSGGNKEPLSTGQKALLQMSHAQPNQDDVRYAIDTEARMEKQEDKTIIQKLGIKKTKPKGDAVDPYEEAAELQKKGIPPSPTVRTEEMPPLPNKTPSSPAVSETISSSMKTFPENPTVVPVGVSSPLHSLSKEKERESQKELEKDLEARK
jgi:hypothetical protein